MHDYSSIRRIAWPFGSRTITDFLKPSLACASGGIATTSGVINCAPALRNRSVSARISFVTTLVCQCQTAPMPTRTLDVVRPEDSVDVDDEVDPILARALHAKRTGEERM